jgi:hypothetical protein
MIGLYNKATPILCISHTANVIGKTLISVLPLAKKFEEKWSSMITISHLARKSFSQHAGVSAVSTSETRWYSWYECVVQIYDKFQTVIHVLNDNGDFCASIREDLIAMTAPDTIDVLQMELALAKDVGDGLVKMCYEQEGDDDFLCTTTFDHWGRVQKQIADISSDDVPIATKRVLLPTVTAFATNLNHVPVQQNFQILAACAKINDVNQKFIFDATNEIRAGRTLRVLRACRLFGYQYIANQPLEALEDELAYLNSIVFCLNTIATEGNVYTAELAEYKAFATLAHNAAEPMSVATFWNQHAIKLPHWYQASRDIALITPSSATSERVFSLLSQGFDSSQTRALQDYKSTAVMLRYNSIWEKKDVE